MEKIVDKKFFNQSANELAKCLIGKWIVRIFDGKEIWGQICETEAYCGTSDSACHSYNNKKTDRTKVMWESGGTIYVYLCYGLHQMFNIVCAGSNPEAVLIRGIVGQCGPGKVTKHLNIDRSLNGENIIDSNNIWLLDDEKQYKFYTTARIGIDYALEKDKNAKLRFVMEKSN